MPSLHNSVAAGWTLGSSGAQSTESALPSPSKSLVLKPPQLAENKTSKGLTFSSKHTHVVCPWHGFEFNIRTGRHPGDRNAVLTPVEVKIRNHDVFVIV